MRYPTIPTVIILSLALVGGATAQQPKQLSGSGISPAVWGILELPPDSGLHPGVVILHGSFGWRPEYARFARALADSGFVALAIDYYAEAGRDTVRALRHKLRPHWQRAIRSAVQYLRSQTFVVPDRIGLVGFSRGAFMAVSVAASTPGVSAVVDYYGGIDTMRQSLEDQVRNFPPLLILHGDADSTVRVAFAHQLRQAVVDHGGEVEMHIYPGAGHAFNTTWTSNYSKSDALDSFRRTIEFLRRRLLEGSAH